MKSRLGPKHLQFKDGNHFSCICGDVQPVSFPVKAGLLADLARIWIKHHRRCKPIEVKEKSTSGDKSVEANGASDS